LSQLRTASPLPVVGTRPDAMPPATAPKQKGVTMDETAKTMPLIRSCGECSVTFRNAKPAPRRTMPSAASPSGM
jgi:hypothetical protein